MTKNKQYNWYSEYTIQTMFLNNLVTFQYQVSQAPVYFLQSFSENLYKTYRLIIMTIILIMQILPISFSFLEYEADKFGKQLRIILWH